MPLTNTEAKNAKPDAKPYKLADGGGMFLLIRPNGSKYWRLKYRFGGKEKLLALGVYPERSISRGSAHGSFARYGGNAWQCYTCVAGDSPAGIVNGFRTGASQRTLWAGRGASKSR